MNAPLPAQHLAPPQRYFWTAPEVATLTRLYPSAGPEACRAALPLRSLSAIYAKALDLGLHAPPNASPGRRRWCWTEADLAELTRVYRAAPDRGAINALARRMDKPRAVVTAKAMNLGLIVPRFAPAPWTAAEEALLRQYAHLCPRRIALRLRRARHPARHRQSREPGRRPLVDRSPDSAHLDRQPCPARGSAQGGSLLVYRPGFRGRGMNPRRRHLRSLPTFADQARAFGAVDAMLARLAEGWIHSIQGQPVFYNL